VKGGGSRRTTEWYIISSKLISTHNRFIVLLVGGFGSGRDTMEHGMEPVW
jgi:hypothetical protein